MAKESFRQANKQLVASGKKPVFVILAVIIAVLGISIFFSTIRSCTIKRRNRNAITEQSKNEEVKASQVPPPVDVLRFNPLTFEPEIYDNEFYIVDTQGNRIRVGSDNKIYYVDENNVKIADMTPNEISAFLKETQDVIAVNPDLQKIIKGEKEAPIASQTDVKVSVSEMDNETDLLRRSVEAFGYDWDNFLTKLEENGSNTEAVLFLMRSGTELKTILDSLYSNAVPAKTEIQPSGFISFENNNLTSGENEVEKAGTPTPIWLQEAMQGNQDNIDSMTASLQNLGAIGSSGGNNEGAGWADVSNPRAKNDWITRMQEDRIATMGYAGQLTSWELGPGTIIPITLLTGLDTDQPGEIIGIIKSDIYDTLTGSRILIPKGSRAMATYNNSVTFGQTSVQIAWTQLITPKGKVYNLPGLNGVSPEGFTGVKGKVNNHFFAILGGAALGSIVQFTSSYVSNYINRISANSYQAELVRAASQSLNQTTANFAQRYAQLWASLGPKITIKKSADLNIFVNRIINFNPNQAGGYSVE